MNAYLDANIVIAYVMGSELEPYSYPFAEQVFNEIDRGLYEGIITHIVLMEILNVLRLIKGREYDELSVLRTERDREDYVRNESNVLYHELLAELLRIHDKIIFKNCNNIDAGDLFESGLALLNDKFGKIYLRYRPCNICGARRDYSIYRGLSPVDLCHVVLAHRLGCDRFITLDKGFDTLIDEPTLDPLDIIILR